MKRILDNPIFIDEAKARKHLEKVRWPDGPVCPHCGVVSMGHYKLPKTDKVRDGLYKCKDCRKQFSVTVGTLFERSHVPLNKWLLAVHLLCASKKGHASHQLHRMLGVTYKTAWFMSHRIREAMSDPYFVKQLGGTGKTVEADETFWGNKKEGRGKRGAASHMMKVFSLVERGGKVRSFHVPSVGAKTLRPIITEQVAKDTQVMTDESMAYSRLRDEFPHGSVKHRHKEYVRGPIHVNTLENYFSILKRGLTGVYQHVGEGHLRRYIGEFDFRYNHREITDEERFLVALQGISGKRLLYTRL